MFMSVVEGAGRPSQTGSLRTSAASSAALGQKSATALRAIAAQQERYLAEHVHSSLPDVCFTANTGRAHFQHRLAILAATAEEARAGLAAFAEGRQAPGVFSRQVERVERPKVAFLFTGQGSQYPGMGRQLYETQPAFRAALDLCDEVLRAHLERPLLEVLFPSPARAPCWMKRLIRSRLSSLSNMR